jgi:hypothetical protein
MVMSLEFAASLLPSTEALAAPNSELPVTLISQPHKAMSSKHLGHLRNHEEAGREQIQKKSEVQNNAYCMHSATKSESTKSPKHQAHGGF